MIIRRSGPEGGSGAAPVIAGRIAAGRSVQIAMLLPGDRPRCREAVQVPEDAARTSPAIAGMMERLKSVLARFGEKCGGMSRAALFISRAIGASDARKLGMHSRLGEGDPEIGGGNPTGKKFSFVSMTFNAVLALPFNELVLIFNADAVRAAGIMLVIYALLGRTDAEVEGIGVPKPIHYMHELEARLKLRILLMALRPVAVMVMSDRGDEVIRSAKGMAGRIGVPLIIRNRRRLVRITGVDLWQ
ncbi:MAG: hypothetical protein MPJ05_08255 [Nitrosopumilus sp.]|nr:hypothetical protein [Nitrosopumilus sp.]